MKPGYCRKSPTKAHHWMFKPQGSPDVDIAKCKWCRKERRFNHPSPYSLTKEGTHSVQLDKKGTNWRVIVPFGRKVS